MTGRKCSTCKHYEPAPIWRKGWCRNPLLYSPQQSHLVGEDDLDCERGMGNYWEAGDPSLAPAAQTLAPVGVDGFSESVSDAFATVPASSTADAIYVPPAAYDAPRAYAVSGGSIGDGDDLPPAGGGARGGGGGGNRQVGYYSDDRYWTDYLRIAAPIIGVLIMVGLFWFWAASFLGNDDNSNKGGVAGTTTALPTISASPAKGSPTRTAGATPTLTIVRTPSSNPTETPGEANGPAPTEDTTGGGGEITNGATVQVFNTGGTGANMRADATTDSDIVATLLDGTQLTVTGDAVQDADGNTWWPVSGDDGDGYIVADYLEVVQ